MTTETKPKLKESFKFQTEIKNGVIMNTPSSIFFLVKYQNGKVIVSVEPIRSARTLNQLAYLWSVVYPAISEHSGHSATEIHEVMKRLFIPPRIIKYRGKELKMAGTTTQLSKGEMAEYITRIIAEAGELGISIPPANPALSTTRLDVKE